MSNLFKKYDVPGPRYTSYPTVPYWDTSPTEDQWLESVSTSLEYGVRSGIGAAIYIHIPFCESLCTYCGCNTRITRNHAVSAGYIETLQKEWELYQARLNQTISISEIHLGGGTPTFLSSDELQRLIGSILEKAQVAADYEFSVEADPRVTTRAQLETLYHLGFKRLSLGIQDFDPKVQETVRRVQSEVQVREVTETARDLGYLSVNFDLIYGLPFQTASSIEKTIQVVQRLRPDRIAFYGYAHVPWIKPSQRRFTESDLPAGAQKRDLYELGRRMLEEVGYAEVGMDHFALKTDSLWKASQQGSLHRNFMGYIAKRVSPLLGLGVSAIGDSGACFSQNEKLLETYEAKVREGHLPLLRGHRLTQEDLVLRKHNLNLMTQLRTNWDADLDQVPYLNDVHTRLSEFVNDGLVVVQGNSCEITPLGRSFMRNICMAFDAHLAKQAPTAQLFSKTI